MRRPLGPRGIDELLDAVRRRIEGIEPLRPLGQRRAVDVIGGFEAWAARGLPVDPPFRPGTAA